MDSPPLSPFASPKASPKASPEIRERPEGQEKTPTPSLRFNRLPVFAPKEDKDEEETTPLPKVTKPFFGAKAEDASPFSFSPLRKSDDVFASKWKAEINARKFSQPLVRVVDIKEIDAKDQDFRCDVVFSFDTTGSMAPVIDSVRRNLITTIDRLFAEVPGIRIGLISHGDYCDYPDVCWKIDLSKDISSIKKFVKEAPNTGGGDAPECYEFAIQTALAMDWKADVRVFVLIGDQSPHEKGYHTGIPMLGESLQIDWREETEKCIEKKITIFSCHAQAKRNQESAAFYALIADRSGGYYFPLEELGSFPEYMVAICLKAADSAENFQLVVERQKELLKEKEEAEKANDLRRMQELEQERKEIDETIRTSSTVATSTPAAEYYRSQPAMMNNMNMNMMCPQPSSSIGGMFNEKLEEAASKIKSSKGISTPAKFASYSNEVRSSKKTVSSAMDSFFTTLSQPKSAKPMKRETE